MLIEKTNLREVILAHRQVLAPAGKLFALSHEDPDLKGRLLPVIHQLVQSGARVDTAVASAGGLAIGPHGS